MPSPTISLRLPKQTLDRLDRAAARARRSRSFLMQEALDRYLDDVERKEAPLSTPLARLMELKGAGAQDNGWNSDEHVIEHVRSLRADR